MRKKTEKTIDIEQKRIREVMKYSGPRMMFYCPGMAIKHLLEKMN